MKLFNIVAWISGILAIAVMLLGTIALITGNNMLSVRREVNFFIVASNLLLLGILCVLAAQGCNRPKKE